jgi:hypothetical protein
MPVLSVSEWCLSWHSKGAIRGRMCRNAFRGALCCRTGTRALGEDSAALQALSNPRRFRFAGEGALPVWTVSFDIVERRLL